MDKQPHIAEYFLLKIYGHLRCRYTKSVHPCTLLAASFGETETSLLLSSSGIHAASENTRRTASTPVGVFCTLRLFAKSFSVAARMRGKFIISITMYPIL